MWYSHTHRHMLLQPPGVLIHEISPRVDTPDVMMWSMVSGSSVIQHVAWHRLNMGIAHTVCAYPVMSTSTKSASGTTPYRVRNTTLSGSAQPLMSTAYCCATSLPHRWRTRWYSCRCEY